MVQKKSHSGGMEDEVKACKILDWNNEDDKSHEN